ncbi:hypothetical protein M3Y97_00845200 [Aphelenchoides bicaudatus]|nr:hypothetical protein M3Y97_00845200 [Aphelenchoides bicaudatus]
MKDWPFKTGPLQFALILSFILRVSGRSEMYESIKQQEVKCDLPSAENCFRQLFANMPICSENELSLRCHHFKVLDKCFREHNTVCSPLSIGSIAKQMYRERMVACARQAQKKYRNVPSHFRSSPKTFRVIPPSELQFISLFGYLQIQCATTPTANCTNEEFKQMITNTSSRLLPFTETLSSEECLIVRSSLSSIFDIHKRYCMQSIVTRCLCERLNFEYYCDIECSNLEISSWPFDQKIAWNDFKGRLTGSVAPDKPRFAISLLLMFLVFRIL